jgi:hypothetical protein
MKLGVKNQDKKKLKKFAQRSSSANNPHKQILKNRPFCVHNRHNAVNHFFRVKFIPRIHKYQMMTKVSDLDNASFFNFQR